MPKVKGRDRCMELNCRRYVAHNDDDYCRFHINDHMPTADEQKAIKPKVYEWYESCVMCSYQGYLFQPRRLTVERAKLWVRSGWMRCPICGSGAVGLHLIDYTQINSPTKARTGAMAHVTPDWSNAA